MEPEKKKKWAKYVTIGLGVAAFIAITFFAKDPGGLVEGWIRLALFIAICVIDYEKTEKIGSLERENRELREKLEWKEQYNQQLKERLQEAEERRRL